MAKTLSTDSYLQIAAYASACVGPGEYHIFSASGGPASSSDSSRRTSLTPLKGSRLKTPLSCSPTVLRDRDNVNKEACHVEVFLLSHGAFKALNYSCDLFFLMISLYQQCFRDSNGSFLSEPLFVFW